MASRTSFEFLRGHKDGDIRLFLKIFTDDAYMMVELNEIEVTELRDTLNSPPTEFDGGEYGE